MILNRSIKTTAPLCYCQKVFVSTFNTQQQNQRWNSTKTTSLAAIASTVTDPPRNLFEVYKKNSHWLDVYKRHEVIKEKITSTELEHRMITEKDRLTSVDLKEYIKHNRTEWTPASRRVGAIGIKLGTTVLWTKEGFRHACTLIQIKDCTVMDAQISQEDGGIDSVTQILMGAFDVVDQKTLANMSKEKVGWYNSRGVFPKQYWTAFHVTKNALLSPGTQIDANHFVPGQYVKVRGVTIDQGFQGVMKRWGMKGQPKSHGQTKTHRKMGATGGGQDPGRIFPGKKMAGHVGGKFSTTHPLKVFRVNNKFNVLYVKGPVPGETGGYLRIYDSIFKSFQDPDKPPPPFPMYGNNDDTLEEELFHDHVCRPTDPSLEFPPFKL